MKIELRKSIESDLELFFLFQLDEEANYLAAFTPENPSDKEAYLEKWKHNMAFGTGIMRTILFDNRIVGSVFTYEIAGEPQISYWLDKDFWGQGITTKALNEFLKEFIKRPLFGRVAFDNHGSINVLRKCGFEKIATEQYYSNARKKEIEEFVFRLQ